MTILQAGARRLADAEPPARTGEADVELVGVTKAFGGSAAVDDVSLAIRPGEFFSLLGPSGCGKTTTLRMIGGFEQPSRGEIRIKGAPMAGLPPNRRPTNMVFQQLALFPHLSVFENIAFGLRVARVAAPEVRRRVDGAVSLVSLEGYESRLASQLSGGQQQRVALARALVNEPSVLLLDEPFAALDLKLRTQMQRELKAIQQRLKTTFVFVTHDQGEAFGMSDRVALLNRGRIEQLGQPRDLYDRPLTPFAATFVGETNLFDAKVVRREGAQALAQADGLSFVVPAGDLQPGDRAVLSLRPERIDLVAPGTQGAVPATVAAVIFQGHVARLTLKSRGGSRSRRCRPQSRRGGGVRHRRSGGGRLAAGRRGGAAAMMAVPISAAPAVRWLLLPAALLLIFAFALPLALFFAQAFHAYSNGKVGADWTLATLNAFLTDPFHLETLYNSFYLAAIVTIICLLIAYPIALVMIRRRGTVLFTFLGIVIFSPVLVSIIVRAYGWQLLLANNGVVNSILLELGLVDRPVRLMFNWLGVIVSMVHVELPFMLFPLLTVLMQLPRGLVEAGHDLGATEFQVWRRIVLPLSLPGVLAGCQVVFSTAISAFASPTVLGGGRVRVMPVTIYQSVVGL